MCRLNKASPVVANGRRQKLFGNLIRLFSATLRPLAVAGIILAAGTIAMAQTITLNGNDPGGTSSFTNPLTGGAAGWGSSGTAASAGNNYEVLGASANYQLRTPAATGSSFNFSGSTLQLDSGAQFIIKSTGGTIGVASLILNGGVVDLSGNASPGATTLGGTGSGGSGGLITLNAVGSPTNTIGAESTQTLTVASVITGAGDVDFGYPGGGYPAGGGATAALSGAVILTASGNNTGATNISSGTLQLGNGGASGSLSTGSLITDNSVFAFNRSNNVTQGTDFNASAITGSGSLVQMGPGLLTLNVANSYTGGTKISGGTITCSADNNLGTIPATVQAANITLNGGALAFTVGTSAAITGGFTLSASRGITLGASGGTIDVNFQDNARTDNHLGSEIALVYNGIITGSGGLTVIGKGGSQFSTSGSSFLDLGAPSTYQGNTTISNAVVQANSGNSKLIASLVNMLPIGTTLILTNSGIFNLDNTTSNQQVAGITGDTTGKVGTTNAGALVLTLGGSGSYLFPGTIGQVTLAGKAGSASAISMLKSGAGIQILSGACTYTGTTNITGGTLQLGNGGTTGALAGGSTITDNATLAFSRSNTMTQGTDFSTAPIAGSGVLVQMGSGTVVLNAANTYSGGTRINGGTLQLSGTGSMGAGTLAINGNSTLDLHGVTQTVSTASLVSGNIISSTTAATLTGSAFNVQSGLISVNLSGATAPLTMSGTGLVTLSGSNAYGGGTSILAGTLKLGNTAALGTAGLTLSGGTLDLNANSISLPTISGTGGLFTDNSAGAGTTLITFNQSSNVNFPWTVTNGPSKLLAVTKNGAGVMTITSANTYSGSTTVNAGLLVVNGAQTGGAGYLIGSSGSLAGVGSISAPVTLNSGSFLAPGSTLGCAHRGLAAHCRRPYHPRRRRRQPRLLQQHQHRQPTHPGQRAAYAQRHDCGLDLRHQRVAGQRQLSAFRVYRRAGLLVQRLVARPGKLRSHVESATNRQLFRLRHHDAGHRLPGRRRPGRKPHLVRRLGQRLESKPILQYGLVGRHRWICGQ